MLVREAKEIARKWVAEKANRMDDFYGAFFSGSTNWMADDALMPPTSDIDIKFVVSDRMRHPRSAANPIEGVFLEASYVDFDHFHSPEPTLATYYEALHFTTPNIILDPTGQLSKIQEAVARDFAKREWVTKRCQNAMERLRSSLDIADTKNVWPEKLFWSLYPFPVIYHIMLAADLRNPSVGNAFYDGKATLAHYGHQQLHEEVLRILGSAKFSQAQVTAHLSALSELLDAAKQFKKTPFFISTKISDEGRPILIDRNQRHMRAGDYREAMFWIAIYITACQLSLHYDAPKEVQDRFAPMLQRLLDDLGIPTPVALQERKEELSSLLPRVWEVAEDIMARNPAIQA